MNTNQHTETPVSTTVPVAVIGAWPTGTG